MRKRALFIIIPVVLAVFMLVYYLFFFQRNEYTGESAMKAIPLSTPLVIRLNNPADLAAKLLTNPMWLALSDLPQVQKVGQLIRWTDSLRVQAPELASLLADREWFIALYRNGSMEMTPVFLVTLRNKAEAELVDRYGRMYGEQAGWQLFDRKYQHALLHEMNNPKNGQMVLSWTDWNGIAIFSSGSVFIEDAIRETANKEKENRADFDMILKTIGKQCDLNILVNHQTADKLLSPCLSAGMKTLSEAQKKWAGWSGFDVLLKDDRLSLSGFSTLSSNGPYLASAWLNQSSGQARPETILPQSTNWFLGYTISQADRFFSDYQLFLSQLNRADQRNNQLKKIENLTGTKIDQLFSELIDKEMAVASLNNKQGELLAGKCWVIKVKSGTSAIERLSKWQLAYVESMKLPASEWSFNYQFDPTTSFTIYRNPSPGLPSILFGPTFEAFNLNYFSSFGNYLIFTDTPESMTTLLESNILGETLNGQTDYTRFQSELTAKSNINFYCNTALSLPLVNQFFNPSISESLSRHEQTRKFRQFDWQVVSSGNMLYNNACLYFNEEIKSKPQTIWKSHLEASSDFKPQFVKNHNDTQNREIMVQDVENNLYLISAAGRIIWKIKLDGPIMSEIYQIDFFKNGKLQYFFNTENRLHLIDRNGNNTGNYPVNLRDKATNGVAVFDYDNNRSYRFFIACSDNHVYAYETSGNLVEGWSMFRTDHPVRQKVAYFRSEGKDYIVVSDDMNDYILNRKGEIRVPVQNIFPHSVNNPVCFEDYTASNAPRLIATDTEGRIHYTWLDGHTEVKEIKTYPADHFFTAVNLDQDNQLEYLFVSGANLEVYDDNYELLLQKSFDAPISYAPNVYHFSKTDIKIGLVSQSNAMIYLINTDGSLHEGFPLEGTSPFSIGFITGNSTNFNLLVGGPGGYIYNYYVE